MPNRADKSQGEVRRERATQRLTMEVDRGPIGDNPWTLKSDTKVGQWCPARDTQIQLFPG